MGRMAGAFPPLCPPVCTAGILYITASRPKEVDAAVTPFYKQGKRKKHREVGALTPVTQHRSAELRLELSGSWAYPVTTARDGRDVTEKAEMDAGGSCSG